MEKQEAFVIGDVHGMEHLLDELLLNWDANCEQLIFVGDLIDRGPNSYNALLRFVEANLFVVVVVHVVCLCH